MPQEMFVFYASLNVNTEYSSINDIQWPVIFKKENTEISAIRVCINLAVFLSFFPSFKIFVIYIIYYCNLPYFYTLSK